jgi:Family of unknown function (DUF6370)
MRPILFAVFFNLVMFPAIAQGKRMEAQPDSTKKILNVKAACGQCQFQMSGTGCELAVRIKGKNYFVDGTGINDHGDAHASDGFCQAIRKAQVQGEIVNNRFIASYFKLFPPGEKKLP